MTGSNIPKAAFFGVFLLLCTTAECHWKPVGPLCASQITLVNHACSFLMLTPSPPLSSHSRLSPPTPDRPIGQHRHGRVHRMHHSHHHSPEEEICCRWLKEVDDQCVCDMLVTLPPFLARPLHQYTVRVGESCYQTFQCGTPIRIND